MKNYKTYTIAVLISALLLIGLAQSSEAITYTFQSYDSGGTRNDMNDLDHYYYYSWKINWNLPDGEVITDARLNISNIWDWIEEDNDILRIYLLDSPPTLNNPVTHSFPTYTTVLSSKYDDQKKNNFFGKGPLVGTWTDPKGGNNGLYKTDLVFTLPVSDPVLADLTDLNTFITNNGIWGFGFDPDCHYFNDGITFTIETKPVPEPSTLLLTGGGLVGLWFIRRKFNG